MKFVSFQVVNFEQSMKIYRHKYLLFHNVYARDLFPMKYSLNQLLP